MKRNKDYINDATFVYLNFAPLTHMIRTHKNTVNTAYFPVSGKHQQ